MLLYKISLFLIRYFYLHRGAFIISAQYEKDSAVLRELYTFPCKYSEIMERIGLFFLLSFGMIKKKSQDTFSEFLIIALLVNIGNLKTVY